MRHRTVESFGSFPASSWVDAFEEELAGATRVRIASGFMDRRGAQKLVETFKLDAPNAHVDFLLGLAGVFGPDVIDVLESHPRVVVRASRLSAFHWKLATIESDASRVVFMGSANFTHKGLGGAGEVMLRLAGGALPGALWDLVQADYDDYFAEGKTVFGRELRTMLAAVEQQGDHARSAQADFETVVERELAKLNAVDLGADVWLVGWDCDLSDFELAQAARVMGPLPPDGWSRGQVSARVARMNKGDLLLCHSRDVSEFVLGRVGKVAPVDLGRKAAMWIADIEHVSLSVDGVERASAYGDVRNLVRLLGDGPLPNDVQRKVLKVFSDQGLLLAPVGAT